MSFRCTLEIWFFQSDHCSMQDGVKTLWLWSRLYLLLVPSAYCVFSSSSFGHVKCAESVQRPKTQSASSMFLTQEWAEYHSIWAWSILNTVSSTLSDAVHWWRWHACKLRVTHGWQKLCCHSCVMMQQCFLELCYTSLKCLCACVDTHCPRTGDQFEHKLQLSWYSVIIAPSSLKISLT